MKIHDLKIDPEYFNAVRFGRKTFEVRKNDRNYEVGDCINLQEYDRNSDLYTGRTLNVQINYILDNQEFLREGYVVLGIFGEYLSRKVNK